MFTTFFFASPCWNPFLSLLLTSFKYFSLPVPCVLLLFALCDQLSVKRMLQQIQKEKNNYIFSFLQLAMRMKHISVFGYDRIFFHNEGTMRDSCDSSFQNLVFPFPVGCVSVKFACVNLPSLM